MILYLWVVIFMMKYLNTDEGFVKIDDYGIIDFLNMNCDGRVYKFMAYIYDDEYAISCGPAAKYQHSDLGLQIRKEFGDQYDASLGACGNQIDFHKYETINNATIDVINDILEDIKYYHEVYNKDAVIRMNNFEYLDGKEFNCNEINQITNMLKSMKNVRTRK